MIMKVRAHDFKEALGQARHYLNRLGCYKITISKVNPGTKGNGDYFVKYLLK